VLCAELHFPEGATVARPEVRLLGHSKGTWVTPREEMTRLREWVTVTERSGVVVCVRLLLVDGLSVY
jgi:hypothetical protein